ncbi:hypothetical protein, partial [Leyella stercorea]|uniref:hypothetical protein n=1 Tax=Leyella stercorea TaxID=363265 RepID=UPI003AF032AD
YVEIVKESCGKKQGQYGLVIYGLSSIHDAKINNNIGLLKTQQYYLIPNSLVGAAETAAPPDKKKPRK